jgi:hypothetical protein
MTDKNSYFVFLDYFLFIISYIYLFFLLDFSINPILFFFVFYYLFWILCYEIFLFSWKKYIQELGANIANKRIQIIFY